MDEKLDLSPSGQWGLRRKSDYELNSAGYGNGGWAIELVEVATGKVVKTWTGFGGQSGWDSWSSGVRNVGWEGELLTIEYSPPEGGPLIASPEERISVEEALARKND